MSADPEILPPAPPGPPDPPADDASRGRVREPEDDLDPGNNYVVPSPEIPLYDMERQEFGGRGYHAVPGFFNLSTPVPRTRRTPNLGHALLFFLLALTLMVTGEGLSVWTGKALHLFGNESWASLVTDARLSIPSQTVEYLVIFGSSSLLFGLLWHRPFLEGIHWNAFAASKRLRWLVLLGILVGFGVGFGGELLPMPKDAPIVQDMMNTRVGAWLMFLFSFTGAPLMEELAFRGFMMPSLINGSRWMSDRGWVPAGWVRWIGVPFAVLVTSCCFALMHAPQVSHSWGPVLLIGIVSLILCIVRLRFDSVLASAVVHSAYNFTLFAGILFTTDGFRHLDKLKG